MKKLVVLFTLVCLTASVYAVPGISFSEGTSGRWDYTATTAGQGVFSFVQPIDITSVASAPADILLSTPAIVDIPDLTVSNLAELAAGSGVYTGDVAANTSIQILDGATVVMTGDLADGAVLTVGSSASVYAVSIDDIVVTSVNAAYNGSAFIGALSVGSVLDFVMTLNRSGAPLAAMILNGDSTDGAANSDNRSLSGSMAVPEPTTLALLALGGLLLRKRK
jgi:hypothetical protein